MPALPPVPASDQQHILAHGEADLMALKKARLFITGGTGFFGTWLLEAISAANRRLNINIEAVVLTRDPAGFAQRLPHLACDPAFEWWQGDIRDFAFRPAYFDCIVHAATSASAALNTGAPREMFDTIVHGTERVLDFALRTRTERLLLTSSGAIYGRQPPEIPNIAEDAPFGPNPASPASAYAEGKRAAELLCALEGRLSVKIARCFAFVGPHLPLDAHFAAGNFIRDALAGREIVIQGDGSPIRSYLHPADLVVWLLAILVRGNPSHPYNVGSDRGLAIEELAHHIAALPEHPISVRIMKPKANELPERYLPDISRARNELGLDVRIGMEDALARTWNWHRNNAQ